MSTRLDPISPESLASSQRRIRKLLFVSISFVASLALAEGLVRGLFRSESVFHRLARPYDERSWRLEWLRRRQKGEANRFSFDQHHPTRGWSLAPNLRDLPAFDGKSVSSTSAGYRGRREPEEPLPVGRSRIVALGDSFTFGEGVGDMETWPARLGALLPEWEVVNLGVHGYGHDQMLITFREEAPRLRPRIVILGYVTDDALRNLLDFRDFAKPKFVLDRGALRLTGSPVPSPDEVEAAARFQPRIFDLASMLAARAAWTSGRTQSALTDVTFAILDALVREIRNAGAILVIADCPVWRELDNSSASMTPREARLAEWCQRTGVPHLQLRPALVAARNSGVRFDSGEHWGAAEHTIAAEVIAAELQRRRLLSQPTR